jgi:NAD(P)-dependent dehydrogenase (short-subunit alcohol dehydrogenase family)
MTVPLGRLAEPGEVGHCAVFLASPLASYVTEVVLTAGSPAPENRTRSVSAQDIECQALFGSGVT